MEDTSVPQQFPLDGLQQVRLAARQAGNSFFDHALVDESYARTLFCGRGLLFTAHRMLPRPAWRPYLAWLTPTSSGDLFALLPHADEHPDAVSARQLAEVLAARIHVVPRHHALEAFTARLVPSAA